MYNLLSGFSIPTALQKRIVKFVLKRSIGQFLAVELDLDNLEVELGKGHVVLKQVDLNVDALNDNIPHIPILFTQGSVEEIRIRIPWKDFLTQPGFIELCGLQVTAVPYSQHPRQDVSPSPTPKNPSSPRVTPQDLESDMLDSGFLTESDILGTNMPIDNNLDGLSSLAHVLDKILAGVSVGLDQATLRLDYITPNDEQCRLKCHINKANFGEALSPDAHLTIAGLMISLVQIESGKETSSSSILTLPEEIKWSKNSGHSKSLKVTLSPKQIVSLLHLARILGKTRKSSVSHSIYYDASSSLKASSFLDAKFILMEATFFLLLDESPFDASNPNNHLRCQTHHITLTKATDYCLEIGDFVIAEWIQTASGLVASRVYNPIVLFDHVASDAHESAQIALSQLTEGNSPTRRFLSPNYPFTSSKSKFTTEKRKSSIRIIWGREPGIELANLHLRLDPFFPERIKSLIKAFSTPISTPATQSLLDSSLIMEDLDNSSPESSNGPITLQVPWIRAWIMFPLHGHSGQVHSDICVIDAFNTSVALRFQQDGHWRTWMDAKTIGASLAHVRQKLEHSRHSGYEISIHPFMVIDGEEKGFCIDLASRREVAPIPSPTLPRMSKSMAMSVMAQSWFDVKGSTSVFGESIYPSLEKPASTAADWMEAAHIPMHATLSSLSLRLTKPDYDLLQLLANHTSFWMAKPKVETELRWCAHVDIAQTQVWVSAGQLPYKVKVGRVDMDAANVFEDVLVDVICNGFSLEHGLETVLSSHLEKSISASVAFHEDSMLCSKESRIALGFNNVTLFYPPNSTLMEDVQNFLIEAPNLVYLDAENTFTHVHVALKDASLHLIQDRPIVLMVHQGTVTTAMVPVSPITRFSIQLDSSSFLIQDLVERRMPKDLEAWRGFLPVARVKDAKMIVETRLDQIPELDFQCDVALVDLELCSDSLQLLNSLATTTPSTSQVREPVVTASLEGLKLAMNDDFMENSTDSIVSNQHPPKRLQIKSMVSKDDPFTIVADFFNKLDNVMETSIPDLSSQKICVNVVKFVSHLYSGLDGNDSRSNQPWMDLELTNLVIDHKVFPQEAQYARRTIIDLGQLDLIDNLHTSSWKKFLTQARPDKDSHPLESKSHLFRAEMTVVRPDARQPLMEEVLFKAKTLPLRMYIDQDTMDFLIGFLAPQSDEWEAIPAPNTTPEPYFQLFELQPIVLVIDYKPKHVDYGALKDGKYVEMLNFVPLDQVKVSLGKVKVAGVHGWAEAFQKAGEIWVPNIINTQIPQMLQGIAPIRSLLKVGTGISDLVRLPVEHYKTDGNIVRGFQRAAKSFAQTTTVEALNIGRKVAIGTVGLLDAADAMLNKTEPKPVREAPKNAQDGLSSGAKVVKETWSEVVQEIGKIPTDLSSDSPGLIKTVAKAASNAVIKGGKGAASGLSDVLTGLKNSLRPPPSDKYK